MDLGEIDLTLSSRSILDLNQLSLSSFSLSINILLVFDTGGVSLLVTGWSESTDGLLRIDVITLISEVDLTAQVGRCSRIVTRENSIRPVQVLQLCLSTLAYLSWKLVFLALVLIEVLGGVILGRVEDGGRGGCNVGSRLEARGELHGFLWICHRMQSLEL